MPLTSAGLDVACNAWKAAYTYLALFNGDPAGAGVELTGGSPAYARKVVTWGATSAGDSSITGAVTFDVAAASTVTHYAFYTAVTAGTQGGSGAFAASEGPYGAQGTYQVTAATIDFD